MKNVYLQEAVRIGDELIKNARSDEHGWYWNTLVLQVGYHLKEAQSENIASGVSGIILFLIELYKHTNAKKYQDAAVYGVEWLLWYCINHPTNYYSFLSGRMGVVYTLIKVYEMTHRKKYLTKALAFAKPCRTFLMRKPCAYEYFNGISGTVLALIFLHAATHASWILEIIDEYVNELIKNAKCSIRGIYWDTSYSEIHPLCGFSHGPSGIGFVFLQLGYYFQNTTFFYIAEQAFAYENNYFDKRINNWPDFRMFMWNEDMIQALEESYRKKRFTVFTQWQDMTAWCHGACGIGLARLAYQELVASNKYVHDIEKAYDKTIATSFSSFTLCHGEGGNADFLLEKYVLFNDKIAYEQAKGIANRAVEEKRKKGEYNSGQEYMDKRHDITLWNGNAGIGYFLLRVVDPIKTTSILAPHIKIVSKQLLPNSHIYTMQTVIHALIANIFPRTLKKVELIAPKETYDFFSIDTQVENGVNDFITFMKNLLQTVTKEKNAKLEDTFRLELKKYEMLIDIQSNGLLFIKKRILDKEALELLQKSDKSLYLHTFQLNKEIVLLRNRTGPTYAYLLKQTPFGIKELPINQFCFIVLGEFEKATQANTAVKNIISKLLIKRAVQMKNIEIKVKEQIRDAIENDVILYQKVIF